MKYAVLIMQYSALLIVLAVHWSYLNISSLGQKEIERERHFDK